MAELVDVVADALDWYSGKGEESAAGSAHTDKPDRRRLLKCSDRLNLALLGVGKAADIAADWLIASCICTRYVCRPDAASRASAGGPAAEADGDSGVTGGPRPNRIVNGRGAAPM